MSPAAPSTTMRLSLLGGFELTYAGEPVRLSAPAQRLLVFLAVTYRSRHVRRAAVAERLWCDVPPARAASNLRSVLWRLPRPRGRQLVTGDASRVRLSPEVGVDLWAGEELAQRLCMASGGARPSPGDDLALLQEDLLPDWYEEWLTIERESYRQKRLHALERASVELRLEEQFPRALSAGLSAVQSEPLRETAHRRVIEVHLAEGNHAEALRQFDLYRRLLADELGIAPSPAIRGLVAPLLGRPLDRRTRAGSRRSPVPPQPSYSARSDLRSG